MSTHFTVQKKTIIQIKKIKNYKRILKLQLYSRKLLAYSLRFFKHQLYRKKNYDHDHCK